MRHRGREVAFHLLFESLYRRDEYGNDPDAQIDRYFSCHPALDQESRRFMEHLVKGVLENEAELDKYIVDAGSNWRFDRIGRTEKTLLRVGIFELKFGDHHGAKTPPEIVIDEVVELAKMYGADESPGFINGILDAVAGSVAPRPNDSSGVQGKEL